MISALFLPLMYRRPRTRQTLKKKNKNTPLPTPLHSFTCRKKFQTSQTTWIKDNANEMLQKQGKKRLSEECSLLQQVEESQKHLHNVFNINPEISQISLFCQFFIAFPDQEHSSLLVSSFFPITSLNYLYFSTAFLLTILLLFHSFSQIKPPSWIFVNWQFEAYLISGLIQSPSKWMGVSDEFTVFSKGAFIGHPLSQTNI